MLIAERSSGIGSVSLRRTIRVVRTRITINGQSFGSVEEMPAEVRRQYESAMGLLADKDGNGIPDVLEGKEVVAITESGDSMKSNIVTNVTTTRLVVNGQEYARWEDVPAAIREAIENARGGGPGSVALQPSATPSAPVNRSPRPIPDDGGIKIGLGWVILLIIAAVVAGMLIALKTLR